MCLASRCPATLSNCLSTSLDNHLAPPMPMRMENPMMNGLIHSSPPQFVQLSQHLARKRLQLAVYFCFHRRAVCRKRRWDVNRNLGTKNPGPENSVKNYMSDKLARPARTNRCDSLRPASVP